MKNNNENPNNDQGSESNPSLLIFALVAGLLYILIIIMITIIAILNSN
ncbi:hypothetical protein M0D46_21085 [Xanthomonas prunicola]|nr:hypothetical protein [Xanthomonas prunicola]UXA69459.1 hypothetical protein M0D46_21085 [Xanthomonas prunicola]